MAQRPFATGGTIGKLRTLGDYLQFYTTALSERFRLTYLDAFAGSGSIPYREELPLVSESADIDEYVEGSARRALGVSPSFHRYWFVESKAGNVKALEAVRSDFPKLADRIVIEREDANKAISSFCHNQMGRSDRCVMFLDPFGNQVKWETLDRIGRTPGIDLWYLFPAGLGVLRQISRDGRVQKDAEASLDLLFGPNDWRGNLISRQTQQDLFGDTTELARRVESADQVTRYMISCMKGVFGGGVSDTWLPLGKGGSHWFSLIFAWSNPSKSATELASRVSKDIMRKR